MTLHFPLAWEGLPFCKVGKRKFLFVMMKKCRTLLLILTIVILMGARIHGSAEDNASIVLVFKHGKIPGDPVPLKGLLEYNRDAFHICLQGSFPDASVRLWLNLISSRFFVYRRDKYFFI